MRYKGYDKVIAINAEYIYTEDELRSRYSSYDNNVEEKEDSDIITPDNC